MKAFTSTTFGHPHESLTALYRQFVRPVLTYASMAWTPDLVESHMEVMQQTQNAALCITTVCIQVIQGAHLYAETKVLPLKSHLEMRRTQFVAAYANPDHPRHHLQEPAPTPHHIQRIPASVYRPLRAWIRLPLLP